MNMFLHYFLVTSLFIFFPPHVKLVILGVCQESIVREMVFRLNWLLDSKSVNKVELKLVNWKELVMEDKQEKIKRLEGDEERKWAKRIVSDFFELLADNQRSSLSTSPFTFLSNELVTQEKKNLDQGIFLAWSLDSWEKVKWTVISEESAPNGSELILTGHLKWDGKQPKDNPRVVEASVRVSKETDGGRWRITFVQLKAPKDNLKQKDEKIPPHK